MRKTESPPTPIKVAYAADCYRRYPGETVTFFAKLTVWEDVDGVLLKINMPVGLEPDLYASQAPAGHGYGQLEAVTKTVAWNGSGTRLEYQTVSWRVGERLSAGQSFEYRVKARVANTYGRDLLLDSWAELFTASGEKLSESEIATVHIEGKARSLDYLPGLYHNPEHELLWRYLMVFDHVWGTYEELLRNLTFYFDPYLAPSNFQSWLASWVGLSWDKRLPVSTQQRLISKTAELYQKRGTRSGLQRYLQLCMNVPDDELDNRIKITENRAGNFIIGEETELSEELVVGTEAEACNFTVELHWPNSGQKLPDKLLQEIIESWKPVHTTYDLISTVDP